MGAGASIANELVLGLGLFFLGMVLTGDNLRLLSGPSFRSLVGKPARTPALGGLIGLGFGALMQSATAVTFILANMVRARLIELAAAVPILLWCNVGLTSLAFVVTFDIHPLVAWFVGGSGILLGLVKKPGWRATAGVCLGIGLILYGLESMSAGAAPLRNLAWFQAILHLFERDPLFAFAGGFIIAALLQSNTGATMLIITLFQAGAFSSSIASPLIYGANLGAIPLRNLLAFSQGPAARGLARVEDAFCLLSGLLMMALFYLEEFARIPLVHALAAAISPSPNTQLALVFLFSNLLPAALLSPLGGRIARFIQQRFPPPSEELPAQSFLNSKALDDPSTALDLFSKEIIRLLKTVQPQPIESPEGEDEEGQPDTAFSEIAQKIDQFGIDLSRKSMFSRKDAHRLHLLRAEFSMVRYIEETVRAFNRVLGQEEYRKRMETEATAMRQFLEKTLAWAGQAADSLAEPDIQALRETTRKTDPDYDRVRQLGYRRRNTESAENNLWLASLQDDFEMALWMLHRFSKNLTRRAEASAAR
ncbi:MAG TPA: Na/Pi symporter [Chthoniobacterales bacterium]